MGRESVQSPGFCQDRLCSSETSCTPVQEFLVPGSQKMFRLRDKIHCLADDNMRAANLSVPAAYFYVEGVFYVDMHVSATDYVRPILDFCEKHSIKPPPEVGDAAEALPEKQGLSSGEIVLKDSIALSLHKRAKRILIYSCFQE